MSCNFFHDWACQCWKRNVKTCCYSWFPCQLFPGWQNNVAPGHAVLALPLARFPVAIWSYSICFGILSSSTRVTWPSHLSLLLHNMVKMLGRFAFFKISVLVFFSSQRIPSGMFFISSLGLHKLSIKDNLGCKLHNLSLDGEHLVVPLFFLFFFCCKIAKGCSCLPNSSIDFIIYWCGGSDDRAKVTELVDGFQWFLQSSSMLHWVEASWDIQVLPWTSEYPE